MREMSKKQTRKLSLKQERFAKEYVRNGGNATQAAIAAGYSAKCAHEQGKENLNKPYIIEAIEQEREPIEGADDRRWKKVLGRIDDALDEGSHYEAMNAVDKVAKILGKYAPAKVDVYIREELERKYAREIRDAIAEEANEEVAIRVMTRLSGGKA